MENIRIRTKEERRAFMDGYEECARFVDKYITEEARAKLKYIIRMVNLALACEEYNKEDK